MVDLVFDIYGPLTGEDVGTRLLRLTREDYGPGTFYKHTLSGIGAGQIIVERDQSFVTAANFAKDNYCIVRDLDLSATDTANVLGGFVFEQDFLRVVADPGQRIYRFGGPSTIALLARAIMGPESLSPFEGPSSIVDGYWRWGSDTYGGVLRRALFEANLQDPPGLPMIDTAWIGADDVFWNDADDSNGDPWPSFVGEFRTRCGTDLLTLAMQLFGFGIEWDIDARTFGMYAYNEGGFGTNRASSSFASGKVLFRAGVNIARTLDRTVHGHLPLTHVLVRTTDWPQGSWIESDSYSPGDPVRKGVYQTGDISGDPADSPAIQQRVQRLIAMRQEAEDGVEFYSSKPGDDPLNGVYQPGPNYSPGATATAGHYWVGDWITVDSGDGDHDYQNATKRIESITYELTTAADDDDHGWNILIGIGPRVGALGTTQTSQPADAVSVPVLCSAIDPGTEGVQRLYMSSNNGIAGLAAHAGWDNDSSGGSDQLKTTADGTFTGGGSGSTSSVIGAAGGKNIVMWRGDIELTSGMADLIAALQAGGAVVRAQMRARMRSGIGISEASQDGISCLAVRATVSNTTTIRGELLDPHTLPSSVGSVKWRASTTHRNAAFPAAAAPNVLAALPSLAVGDHLAAEFGHRNYTTVTSGGAVLPISDETAVTEDLPEDDASTADLNSWLEIRYVTGVTGTGLHPDLVGTDTSAARCDHKHHVISNRAPTSADNIEAGYPDTTLWTNTETGTTYLLVDQDAGTWITIADPSAPHTHVTGDIADLTLDSLVDVDTSGVADTDVLTYDAGSTSWVAAAPSGGGSLTVEEEDASPSVGSVSTIQVPNGTLTNDGGGTVSLAYATVGHTHGGGSGGVLQVPDLINSLKASADTPDDEFPGTSLDGKWTVVDGSSGSIGGLLSGSGAGIYEVGARDGWLMLKLGTASGDGVVLRQDYTLPDGNCIVAAMVYAVDQVVDVSNNEILMGIGVNDNDGGIYSSSTGQTLLNVMDTQAGSARLIGLEGSGDPLGTTPGAGVSLGDGTQMFFVRIDRTGLNYDAFGSKDGFAWTYLGRKTMASAANNIWLFAVCEATMANRTVVGVAWFRQGTALALDPWPL